jgi:DNA-directed RNA polymerase specialized sigma24 family protein
VLRERGEGRLDHVLDDAGAAGRDDGLFAELYPSLRRLAAVVRPPEEDTDDLVQEALARALAVRPLAEFDDAGAYLRTTIIRLASNHRRRLGRQRRAYQRALGGGEQHSDYPSDLDDLRRLGVRDRAVLYLALVEAAPTGRSRTRSEARKLRCGHAHRRAATVAQRPRGGDSRCLTSETCSNGWPTTARRAVPRR